MFSGRDTLDRHTCITSIPEIFLWDLDHPGDIHAIITTRIRINLITGTSVRDIHGRYCGRLLGYDIIFQLLEYFIHMSNFRVKKSVYPDIGSAGLETGHPVTGIANDELFEGSWTRGKRSLMGGIAKLT